MYDGDRKMKLIEAIDDYLRFLKFEKGAAKTTCKTYHANLYHFHRWLEDNGYQDSQLKDFNHATVKRYFYAVSNNGLRPRTIHGYMIPIRSLGTYLLELKAITENPTANIQLPKKDAAIRREATEDELLLLLEHVDRQRDKKRAALQKAVLAVLTFCGLRRAELCDLKLNDIDLKTGWLLVTSGKGSKSRKVPLCIEATDALTAWINVRPAETKHDYLFTVDIFRRLHFEGIRSLIEDCKHRAGLGDRKDLTPHCFRHAFATRLLRQGASIDDVKNWLGHTDIATTQRYLHLNEMNLKKTAEFASIRQSPKEEARPAPNRPTERMERNPNAFERRRRLSIR